MITTTEKIVGVAIVAPPYIKFMLWLFNNNLDIVVATLLLVGICAFTLILATCKD